MINYTIDKSLLKPPIVPSKKDNIDLVENFNGLIIQYYNNIKNIAKLKEKEDVNVYLFRFTENYFNTEYKTNANKVMKFSSPYDLQKIFNELIKSYHPEPNKSHGKKKKQHFLEDKFNIDTLEYEEPAFNPPVSSQSLYDNDDIVKIGILNNYIYKNTNYHFLVRGNNNEYAMSIKINRLLLNRVLYKKNTINTSIKVIDINSIILRDNSNIQTVFEAYQKSKKIISDYVIFGNDIEKGIRTIKETAGPPARIFYYLLALKEYYEYKKNKTSDLPDEYILNALGCDCANENPEKMKLKNVWKDRMYDYNNSDGKPFTIHLRPSTYDRYNEKGKSGTVRIYLKWDENQEKVVIGWIGKHPFLP